MKLIWIEDFLTLATSKTFSEAAQRRHVTQPAFSRRIAMLEKWLGVQLINRQTRGSELTPTAARFEADMHRLLDRAYELRNHMRADAIAESRIRLVMQHTLMMTHFPQLLGQLQTTCPESTFDVRTDNFEACFMQLSRGEADLVLCFETEAEQPPAQPIEVEHLLIGQESLVPVATPRIAAQALHEPSTQRLIKLLNYPEESFLGRAIRRECLPHLIKHYMAETVCESAFTAGIKAMTLAGMGIAWLPYSLVDQELADSKLIALQAQLKSTFLGISLYRIARNPDPNIDKLWSALQKTGRFITTR